MSKYSLVLDLPVMNAAGSLGFAPDLHGPIDLSQLGAFITNPISPGARTPAREPRYREYPGGFMIHTGYPNPGLKVVLRRYAEKWARSPLPVWVHLLAGDPHELAQMVRSIEGLPGVSGLEIGLPPDVGKDRLDAYLDSSMGELPVVVRLPFEHDQALAERAVLRGAEAVSLSAPRGALTIPGSGIMQGRLFGPAVFPLALRLVHQMAARGVPVIGAGGISQQADVDAMLSAGALAVQLDAALWRGY